VALLTWVACLPIAFAVVKFGGGDPFHLRTAMVPLVIAVAGVAAVGIAASWWSADLVSGVAAGLLGGWVAFTLRLALHGTPYGFDGLGGDAARMADMANRYASSWRSSDMIVPSVPSHYPPLFPWLVGRTSALVNVPAWRLLGPAEAITLSFAVVVGFVLWRLLVPGPLALALALPVLLSYSLPEKAYEIVALAVLTPWVLATFGQPPRGRRRLHWLPAGLIGGLSIVLYWAFTIYAGLGIVALVVLTWRASTQRAQYVRHVALTVAVAVVVASWYLVPYLGWGLLHQSSQVDDLYQGGGISASPLPFLAMTPLGVLELIGLAGLVWWRGRVWWGKPLLLLTGSAYAYWLICLVLFSVSGHTALLQDTPRVIEPLLAAAGVLSIVQASPGIVRRLAVGTVPAGLPTVALCLLTLWTVVASWQAWMPGGPASSVGLFEPAVTTAPNESTNAFTTALPDGIYPTFGPASLRQAWFPVDPIKADVESVLGPGASPVTLSSSEALFAFVNWPGYVAVSETAAGTNTDWPARYAALQRLSGVTDPAAFATASAQTAFGPIDVFILHAGSGHWTWTPVGVPNAVSFSPAQFSSPAFTVFTGLPGHLVVAVRQPSQPS
jgi:Arabinofuranosyltransferase N terminal